MSNSEAQSSTDAVDRAIASTRHALGFDGDAPKKAAQAGPPHHKDSSASGKPQFSVSAFANSEAGGAADHPGEPFRAGQVAAAGPVKRLLASHALSLASSLTSESSLLDGQALDQLSSDEPQSPAKAVYNTAEEDSEVADTDAANIKAEAGRETRKVQGSSGAQPQKGNSAKGPMQRVLASHALSLASSLMSETSMSNDDMLDDAISLPADRITNGVPTGMTVQSPVQDLNTDAEEASGCGQVNAEAKANDTTGAKADSIDVYKACNAGGKACQASQQSRSYADNVARTHVSPCPTEPMSDADTPDDMQTDSEHNMSEQLDGKKKPYHLIAAVVHHGGGSGSGHYTVFRCQRLDSQKCQGASSSMPAHDIWFSISDESVCQVKVSDVLACEATLLLYEEK